MYLELHRAGEPQLVNFDTVTEVMESGPGAKIVFNGLDAEGEDIFIRVDESYHYIKEKLLSHQRAMIPQSHLI